MDTLGIARYGMQAAQARFDASATRIAANPQSDTTVSDVVDMKEAKQAFVANAQVAKVANEMWDSLLAVQEHANR